MFGGLGVWFSKNPAPAEARSTAQAHKRRLSWKQCTPAADSQQRLALALAALLKSTCYEWVHTSKISLEVAEASAVGCVQVLLAALSYGPNHL